MTHTQRPTAATAGVTAVTNLVLMTGITAAIRHGFSALTQIKCWLVDNRTLHTSRYHALPIA